MFRRAVTFVFASALLAQAPAFDVASVKRNTSTDRGGAMEFGPGRLRVNNLELADIVMRAYSLSQQQFSFDEAHRKALLPILLEKYDIDAKASRPSTRAAMKIMLQNLLAERFQLAMHRETKELPGYLLTVDPGGPKLREHEGGGPECVSSRSGNGALRLQNCPLDIFVGYQLNGIVRGLVADRTGLTGNYDFELLASWEVPANPAEGRPEPRIINPDAPSIFVAVRQQLGLRLESRKIELEMVTIDRVERAASN
jgi:uncharacterized protein (TIGR03435 family)